MITGPQIFAARRLLKWTPSVLADKARVTLSVVNRAESSHGEPMISITQLDALLRAFREAGIEFVSGGEGEAGVRERKAP